MTQSVTRTKDLLYNKAFCSSHYGYIAQSGLYNVRLHVPLVYGIVVSKTNIGSISGIELHKASDCKQSGIYLDETRSR